MLRANFISLWFLFFLVSLVSLFLGISRPDSGENKTGMGGHEDCGCKARPLGCMPTFIHTAFL